MQYSPKLKKVMEQIKQICKDEDIAVVAILHTPGHSEFYMGLEPSYSCAKFEGDTLRVKAKLAEFNGDRDAWTLKMSTTSNMLNLLGETTLFLAENLAKVSRRVDEAIGAEHNGPSGPTSHTQQNN